LNKKQQQLTWWKDRLKKNFPHGRICILRKTLSKNHETLLFLTTSLIKTKRLTLRELTGRLNALNPTAVLDRGYSITRSLPDKIIITDTNKVFSGQLLEILLANGTIRCRVEPETENFKKDKFNGEKKNI
jgi:exodeoxyribonuclease VII large subunit